MLHPIYLFLNIGSSEMVLIMFVALLLFGGEKLPQLAKGLGKGIRDFKDASEGVKREIHNQINNFEEKSTTTDVLPDPDPNLPVVANTTPLADPFAVPAIEAHETHTEIAPAGESHADLSHLTNATHTEVNHVAENHISISHVSEQAKVEEPAKKVQE